MAKKPSRAHVIRAQELPIRVIGGGVRIEISCPSGCVQGYLWSKGDENSEHVRAMAQAAVDKHQADMEGSR